MRRSVDETLVWETIVGGVEEASWSVVVEALPW